ncbi:hypothetical protein [Pseudomonas viridiflava]|uniref:hypothetical protein n=1 Tax=Pseudomonas viridiflava TaxID=33069 RepID=UPI000F018B45|nr:hypothetical protein [Pseudomonas viridiflava]
MFSSSSVPCAITRVCRHTETVCISYRYAKEKEQERKELSRMLCTECENRLKTLFAEPGDTIFDLELPQLRGSDKQISWAHKLRAERWRLYGAMLQTVSLENPEDPLTLAMYRSLLCYGSMDDARYWIDLREMKPNFWSLKSDVEFCLKVPGYGVMIGEFSPYGRLQKFNPSLLGQILRAIPPPSGSVAQSKAG